MSTDAWFFLQVNLKKLRDGPGDKAKCGLDWIDCLHAQILVMLYNNYSAESTIV